MSQPDAPSPSTKPSWTFRRLLVRLALLGSIVALLTVTCWMGINWAGKRQLRNTIAEIAASGEVLDINQIALPAVSDADNFFGCEPLKDLAEAEDGDVDKGKPAERRARLISVLASLREVHDGRPDSSNGAAYGIPWDAVAWARYFREAQLLQMPSTENPGMDILAGMNEVEPLLAELGAALSRRASQFTPAWADRYKPTPITDVAHPATDALILFVKTLNLHALAASAGGAPSIACRDVQMMLRIAEGSLNEPLVIDSLVGFTLLKIALDATWEVLRRGEASEQGLLAIDQSLARFDFDKMVHRALRGELAFMCVTDVSPQTKAAMKAAFDPFERFPPWEWTWKSIRDHLYGSLLQFGPEGLSDYSDARTVRMFRDSLVVPSQSGLRPLMASLMDLSSHLNRSRDNHVLLDGGAIRTLPTHTAVMGSRHLILRALVAQARTAIALARYKNAHSEYPKAISALVPDFMEAVPDDAIDGKPLRYSIAPEGHFKLWSIGLDGQDDGGVVLPPGVAFETAPSLTAQDFQGDWVWSYQRLVPEKHD
ncbi:MAG: hypothetical protein JNM99_20270 [Verrucomicrobiaceae bacterium]|nr:hypothetical protein [Verrucomicrobiaceae bacterium]